MGDDVVHGSPLMGGESPGPMFSQVPDNSGNSCWPCSQSYNLAGGDNPRFKRKTLIGILCLFLVFVVVLAIIIFAVTRDSVGTKESQEAQLGIRKHEDRNLKLHAEDRTVAYDDEESTTGKAFKKQNVDKRVKINSSGEVLHPTTSPSDIDRSDINEFDSLKQDSPWDDFEEVSEVNDDEPTTKYTTAIVKEHENKASTAKSAQVSSTERLLAQGSSTKKSSVRVSSESDLERRHYYKVLLDAVVEMPWKEDKPTLNETSRAELQAAVDYFMESIPRQRSLSSEDGIKPADKLEFLSELLVKEKRFTNQSFDDNEGEELPQPKFEALSSSLDFGGMFARPLDNSKLQGMNEQKNLSWTEEKQIVAERVQSLLELIGGQNKVKDVSSVLQNREDLSWLGNFSQKIQDLDRQLNESAIMGQSPNNSSGLFYTAVIDKITQAWEKYLIEERTFGFNQVHNMIMNATGLEMGRHAIDRNNGDNVTDPHKQKMENMHTMMESQIKAESLARMSAGNDVSKKVGLKCNNETQRMCNDGNSCYFKTERCDRWINCLDNSDELDCSCVEYLDPDKICDGYADCPLGEDEVGCGCPLGSFRCSMDQNIPQCILMSFRCDNAKDCDSGRDEKNCFTLSQSVLSPNAFGGKDSAGILHARVKNKWSVLGLEMANHDDPRLGDFLQTLSNDVCSEILTRPSNDAKIQFEDISSFSSVAHLTIDMDAAPVQGMNVAREGNRFAFTIAPPHLGSTIVSVDCGNPVCGIRSELPQLFSFKATATTVKPGVGVNPGSRMAVGRSSTNDDFNLDGSFGDASLDYSEKSTDEIATMNDAAENENATVDVRIVGGTEAPPQQWPFVAALIRDGRFICGCTILNSRWIITAGHCLYEYDTKKYNFQVIVGTIRRNALTPTQYVRTIEEVHIHEKYNSTWLFNDIALGKVDLPFSFSQSASMICLPDQNLFKPADSTRVVPRPGDKCFAAGWGNTDEIGQTSESLMDVEIPIFPNCKNNYNDLSYQICGGYKDGGKDSCQGDSGGPLFCKHPSNPDTWYLGGVISHGVGCARPDNPGVYTRVNFYMKWITSVISPDVSAKSLGTEPNKRSNTNCPTLTCDDGRCLPATALCNFFVDCFDGTDEANCIVINGTRSWVPRPTTISTTTTSLQTTAIIPGSVYAVNNQQQCSTNMFRCLNTEQCIPKDNVCDKKPDCVDGSDERGCRCRDFLEKFSPHLLCDAHPDCPDWGDEIGCKYCPSPNMFFCDLSKTCVERSQVCDQVNQCDFKEDERYCLTLVTGDSVALKQDGRPNGPSKGLVAINTAGVWKPVCTEKWDDTINDRSCRYTGKRAAVSWQMIAPKDYLNVIKNVPLKIMLESNRTHFPRSPLSSDVPDDGVNSSLKSRDFSQALGVTQHQQATEVLDVVKRQATDCSFVEATCTATPSCGLMPLYNFLGDKTPEFGKGVFPWQVNIYKNGKYLCGASLIHRSWILTHKTCADKCDPAKEYCVARMGGYLDNQFQSAFEVFRRIVMFVQLPGDGKNIFLGTFDLPVELNEYINTLCIPSLPWVPKGTNCFITGKTERVMNHAIKTQVVGACDVVDENKFNICTKLVQPNFECIDNFSGAMACPDGTGKYYAVGIYFSEQGGCDLRNPHPSKFETVSSAAVRDNIAKVIKTADDGPNPYFGLEDKDCSKSAGFLRCPLGNCLNPSQLCDGVPDCIDLSDENATFCRKQIRSCQHVNATHCQCLTNDLKCKNNMCVDKSRFCDGVDDCGDGTDEPKDCAKDCAVALQTLNPSKLCDSKIDCVGEFDLGRDESASRCCSSGDFRCVLGEQSVFNQSGLSLSKECISSQNVCDYNLGNSPSCSNGADEQNCFRLWNLNSDIPLDPFGRAVTEAQGFLYFVSHGKKYLYCASKEIFTENILPQIGRALCLKANFVGMVSIKLTETSSRQLMGGNVDTLPNTEQQLFTQCLIVHLVCSMPSQKQY